MRYGIIHSIETCGTVDGPGLRFVVFTQGCLMRCLYCHNRDTWDMETDKSRKVTVDELMQQVIQYRFYLKATGGGVTASGGESLLQPEFIRDWFVACKAYGIHTCLDTNGYARYYDDTLKELLDHTDLVMLDLKQLDNEIHKKTRRRAEHPYPDVRQTPARAQPAHPHPLHHRAGIQRRRPFRASPRRIHRADGQH